MGRIVEVGKLDDGEDEDEEGEQQEKKREGKHEKCGKDDVEASEQECQEDEDTP
jgi:hypothetical protein